MCQAVEAVPPWMRAWLALLRCQHPIHSGGPEEVVEAVQPPLPRTPLPVEAQAG